MARRGLTIIDMVIALALIVALAALAAPHLTARLAPATAQAVSERAAAAIALARLDAMRDRTPVRLVARENDEGVLEILGLPLDAVPTSARADLSGGELFDALTPAGERSGQAETRPAPASRSSAGAPDVSMGVGRSSPRERVYLALPPRYALSRTEPEPEEMRADPAEEIGPDAAAPAGLRVDAEHARREGGALAGPLAGRQREGDRGAWLTLAVFLPDGSAVVGDPVFVRRDGRAIARWEINRWSGALRSEPITEADIAERSEQVLESTDPAQRPEIAPPEAPRQAGAEEGGG